MSEKREFINKLLNNLDDGVYSASSGVGRQALAKIEEYIDELEACCCNRSDCAGRIKNSKKFDSVQQKIDKTISDIEIFKNDIKEYQEKDKLNHKTISIGLVGVRLNTFLKDLRGEEDASN